VDNLLFSTFSSNLINVDDIKFFGGSKYLLIVFVFKICGDWKF